MTARVEGGKFAKGVSANPAGGSRPGPGRVARAIVDADGVAVIVATALDVAQDKTAAPSERLRACEWLAQNGYGVPSSVASELGELSARLARVEAIADAAHRQSHAARLEVEQVRRTVATNNEKAGEQQ